MLISSSLCNLVVGFFFLSHQLKLKHNSHFTSSPEIGFMFNLRLEEIFNQVTSHPHECHSCVDVLMPKQHEGLLGKVHILKRK